MTTERIPTIDTQAVVEIRITIAIPNDAEIYDVHGVNTQDSNAIRTAGVDEAVSWGEVLGCTVRSVDAEVLGIYER